MSYLDKMKDYANKMSDGRFEKDLNTFKELANVENIKKQVGSLNEKLESSSIKNEYKLLKENLRKDKIKSHLRTVEEKIEHISIEKELNNLKEKINTEEITAQFSDLKNKFNKSDLKKDLVSAQQEFVTNDVKGKIEVVKKTMGKNKKASMALVLVLFILFGGGFFTNEKHTASEDSYVSDYPSQDEVFLNQLQMYHETPQIEELEISYY